MVGVASPTSMLSFKCNYFMRMVDHEREKNSFDKETFNSFRRVTDYSIA
jgi:hypothetical protein